MEQSEASHGSAKNLRTFFLLLGGLAVLRLLLSFVSFPVAILPYITLLLIVIYVGVPILALYGAAKYPWTTSLALRFLVIGAALHVGGFLLVNFVVRDFAAAIADAVAQFGLLTWCVGLGALLATLIKDRNLLIPVAIFLAALDFFLVLTPIGPTRRMIETAPKLVATGLVSVPKAQEHAKTGARAPSLAVIGPADFMFLTMFFVAMFRFSLRSRVTLYAVLPTLILYLLMVLNFGNVRLGHVKLDALPALVPIGLCVLFANWGEFKLNKEEKVSTVVVVAMALGLIAFGMTRAPAPVPSKTGGGQAVAAPAGSPAPASRG